MSQLLTPVLIFIFAVWVKRIFWMRRFRRMHPPLDASTAALEAEPKVSVIVPAKNEEKNIGNCLKHLFTQNYKNFEIVAVDDRSTDQTPHLLENFQKLSPVPFKIVRIEKLPPGWTGKNYAVFTGSKAASGEWLLFTDADTTHRPASLRTAATEAICRKIDFLTLAPEVESHSFWEKTIQPLATGSLALWFDPLKINDSRSGVTLANGQFILVRKDVYEKSGGNEAVKTEIIEDVELAKRVRALNYSVQFLDGTNLYSTRMYSSLREIYTGWTRIFTHLFEKNVWAILHKIFLFLFFSILPFAILAFRRDLLVLSASVCGFIVAVRFAGNKMVKSNPWYAFLHPLGSLVMVWILSACVGRILLGRSSPWRGDSYR